MSKEKMGSEMVQIEFRNGDEEIKQKIFNALKSEILILSTDQFGNYVIQALLYYGDEEKLNIIFETFKNKLFDLSTHTYGCRVIQTLISVLSNSKKDKEKIKYILKELTDLDGYLGDLFTDKNGNHVIQQIINVLDIDDLTTGVTHAEYNSQWIDNKQALTAGNVRLEAHYGSNTDNPGSTSDTDKPSNPYNLLSTNSKTFVGLHMPTLQNPIQIVLDFNEISLSSNCLIF